MNQIGVYIYSVISASILVGIVSMVSPSGAMAKTVGGLVLLIVMLYPLARFDLGSIEMYLERTMAEGEDAAEQGSAMSEKAIASLIKTKTEAYILDKAGDCRAEIEVEVQLSEDEIPCPVGVIVNGSYDAETQRALQELMETELGITKERQIWNGPR